MWTNHHKWFKGWTKIGQDSYFLLVCPNIVKLGYHLDQNKLIGANQITL
jgi:hypothetical protein